MDPTSQSLPAPGPRADRWERLVRVVVAFLFAGLAIGLPLHAAWGRIGALVAFVGFLAMLWGSGDRERRAPGRVFLTLAALGTVAGAFAFANPWGGIEESHWPWEYWMGTRRWVDRVDLVLWALVAALAGWAAWSRRAGVAAGALGAAVLLGARGFSNEGALVLIRVARVNLVWTLAAGALGGALLYLSGAGTRGRGAARAVAGFSALLILVIYAAWFPDPLRPDRSSIAVHLEELPGVFDDAFRGGESSPTHMESRRQQAWMVGVPVLSQAIALLLAAVVALLPGRRHGRGTRWLAATALVCLFATWLIPVRAEFYALAQRPGAVAAQGVLRIVVEALVRAGLVLFLVLSGGVAALIARRAEHGQAPSRPPREVPSRGLRWLHGAAAVLGGLVLWATVRPGAGLEVDLNLWEALTNGTWDVGTARALFRLLLVVVPTVAIVLPYWRVRGTLALTTALIGFTVFSSGQLWIGLIEHYVIPAVAAVAAVAAARVGGGPRRGSPTARAVAGVAAVLVFAALFYPKAVPTQIGLGGTVHAPYESALIDNIVLPLAVSPDVAATVELVTFPQAWLMITLAVVALAAVLAAILGRGAVVLGRTAQVAWLAGVVGAWLFTVVVGTQRGDTASFERWLTWVSAALRDLSVPTFLLWFAGLADLAGRAREGVPGLAGGRPTS